MAYNIVLRHARSLVRTLTNACRYIIYKYEDLKGLAAILFHTVSRCHTRHESNNHTGEKPQKRSTLAF